MPVMSGQDDVEAMGRNPTLAKVPILVLTGVTDPRLDRVVRVVSVMRKPVVLHALVQKVEALLRG